MPEWDGLVVGEIAALKRQTAPERAQEMLERVARYVLPIMRRRGLRVGTLREFLPRNPNLLGVNVNRGQRINLRLRYHHHPSEMLPFESVLGTMLHELCHNTYGPHGREFFALLDELTTEMDALLAKGFRGDPFIGTGQMVGGSGYNPYPRGSGGCGGTGGTRLGDGGPSDSGQKPKRARRGRRLGGLGVPPPVPGTRPARELILQAAERRRQADSRCRAVRAASDLSPRDGGVVDLTVDDDDDYSINDNTTKDTTKSANNNVPEKNAPGKNTEGKNSASSDSNKGSEEDIVYILD